MELDIQMDDTGEQGTQKEKATTKVSSLHSEVKLNYLYEPTDIRASD